MRLIAGLTAAALSGLAAAATQQSADVYLFPSPSSSSETKPNIPKEVARHILLQRTSRQRYGSDLRDIPSSVNTETAVAHIARFGKTPAPLFARPDKAGASQLVIIFEGAASEHSSRVREKLGQHAAFTISDPPSATANNQLMALFQNLGVETSHRCELAAMLNPIATDCWTGPSLAVKYDLRASPKELDSLLDNVSRLETFVSTGDLELLLVILPESSRKSKLSHWSAAAAGSSSPSDLRRRHNVETVISDQADESPNPAATHPATKPTTTGTPARRTKKPLPQCFPSLNSCMSQTNSCSDHGKCVDKYALPGGGNSSSDASTSATAGSSCFVCVCQASVVEPGEGANKKGRKTVHWGGNMCQKEDVSVPFWLIAGFTVTMIGAVSFAIGLLFGVGEEKLPGVIGAGVSRSK